MRNEIEDYVSASYEQGWQGLTGWYKDKQSMNKLSGSQLVVLSGRAPLVHGNHIDPTAYSAFRVSCRASAFNARKHVSTKYGTYENVAQGTRYISNPQLLAVGLGGPPSWLPQVNGALKARARTQALNKLASSKVDLGESLGDIKQTGQMMANSLRSLASAFAQARKGNMGGAANALGLTKEKKRSLGKSSKNAANNWLALQFGWLPIMNDIYNGHAAIKAAFAGDDDQIIEVKAVATGSKGMPVLSGLSYTGSLIEGCQVGIHMKVANNVQSGLNQLNLLNPLGVGWQLLPLSFVVDWFVSVGDYLSALGADLGLEFRAGYETYFVKGKNITLSYTEPFWGEGTYGSEGSWKISVFSMQRVVLQQAPPPGLYMKLGLDLGKASTAVALLTQRA